MGTRRLLGGFAALAGAMLVTQAVGFAALAVASRQLGPGSLGAANFATSLSTYFAIPANFGLALLGMRDVARHPDRAEEIMGEILTLRIAIAVGAGATMALTAPVIAANGHIEALIPLAALAIPFDALSGEWALLGAQRRGSVAVARLAGQALYAVLVFVFLTGGLTGAREYIYYSVASIAVTSAITQVRAWQLVGRPRLGGPLRGLGARARASIPLGIAVVMVQINFSVGILMLGYLESAAAVGQFTVAQKLPLALYAVIQLWSATLYPQAARLMVDRREQLRGHVALFSSLSCALGLPLTAGAILVGPDLIPAMFGARYGPAGTVFVLIAASLAVSLVTVNVGSVLAAGGQERAYAAGRTLGALVSVVACAVAIPLLGLDGAAVALVVAEAAVLAFMVQRYRGAVGPVALQWGRVARGAGATAVMVAALLVLGDGTGVAVRLVAGIATFSVAALALGVVRRDELRRIVPSRPAPEVPAD